MPGDPTMLPHLYPALALNTEGDYSYLKSAWRNGKLEKWQPYDGESGFNAHQITAMRYQHAVIGINTECSELMQLFIGDYLATLDAPLEKVEAIKELGDIMWYVSLAYQALLTFHIPTSPKLPVSQSAVIRFSDAVCNAQEIADASNSVVVPTTLMDLAVSAQHAGNLLLKWFKNACFYGQVRDQGEIGTQLALIVTQVAKMAKLLGVSMQEVLEINIDKLKRRYPNGFNGVDAVAQADEAPGYKSVSDRPNWDKDAAPQFLSEACSANIEQKTGQPVGLIIEAEVIRMYQDCGVKCFNGFYVFGACDMQVTERQ